MSVEPTALTGASPTGVFSPAPIENRVTEGLEKIELRKFPYPYRAALALANDIDLTSWDDFVNIFSYLCSTKETPLGRGLGLPFSSSFYLFNPQGGDDEFAYFGSLDCKDGPHRRQIEHLIRTGYLDTLHGFGSFDQRMPFKRSYAEKAYKILADRGWRLKVWTNHGVGGPPGEATPSVDSSRQVTHAKGDYPGSPAYHFDLTRNYGVKFIWQWNDGGLSSVIGQDTVDFLEFGRKMFIPIAQDGRKAYQVLDLDQGRSTRLAEENSLLVPIILKDGSRAYNIRRFILIKDGGLKEVDRTHNVSQVDGVKPTASNFYLHLNPIALNKLILSQGYLLIYQHLGAATGANGQAVKNTWPYFSRETRKCLEFLAAQFQEGVLLAAPLSDLLEYNYVYHHLKWRWEREESGFRIMVDGIKDDFLGLEENPEREHLAGLTFYTPDPERTAVYIGSERQSGIILNPADHLGRKSVMLPWKRREDFEII